MMRFGSLTGYIDAAQVTLYAFWVFFFGLVFYLRREDKREGYPLVSEIPGHTEEVVTEGVPWMPPQKTYTWHDGDTFDSPITNMPSFPEGARQAAPWPGAPLDPTGNPLLDGLGPAAWAFRQDKPETTIDGKNKILPMRLVQEFYLHEASGDPRGLTVVGADNLPVGRAVDLWIDTIEQEPRYVEVQLTLPGYEGQVVLVPDQFMRIRPKLRQVSVRALMARQFIDIPRVKNAAEVTKLEEEKLIAYFGGGLLYATPNRLGPLL